MPLLRNPPGPTASRPCLSSPCPRQRSPGPGPCLRQGAVSSHGIEAVQPSTLTVPGALRGSAPEEREPSGLQGSQDPPKARNGGLWEHLPAHLPMGRPQTNIFADYFEAYEPNRTSGGPRTPVEARFAARRPRGARVLRPSPQRHRGCCPPPPPAVSPATAGRSRAPAGRAEQEVLTRTRTK